MKTNSGLKIMINRTYKDIPDYTRPSQFKIGINQSDVSIIDNDLTIPIPISGTELADNCETTTDWPETTDGSNSLNNIDYKEGFGALNLIKSGITLNNVTYYNNNNMTSLDFTNKDLWIWLYIKDTTTLDKLAITNALEIRYGNDYNTNYYNKYYNKSDLVVGWNALKMNTIDGTETGTVTLTSCDSGAIKITFTDITDTIAAGDIIMDEWKLVNASGYLKDFDSITIDESTFEAQRICYLNSLDANGYFLSGIADFNTDAPLKMNSGFKYTGVSKSNTDEIKFYLKSRLVRR